jgi:hypothetical protein
MKTKHFLVTVCFFAAIIFFNSCVKLDKKKCHIYPLNTETLCTDFITELGDSMWYCEKVTLDQRDVTDSVLAIGGGSLSFARTGYPYKSISDHNIYFFNILVKNSKGSVRLLDSRHDIMYPFPEKLKLRGLPYDTTTPMLGDGIHKYPIFEDNLAYWNIEQLQQEATPIMTRKLVLSKFDSAVSSLYSFTFTTR